MARHAVETDPTNRFVRYPIFLGKLRSGKTLYLAYDKEEGVEVTWSIDKCGSTVIDNVLQNLEHIHLLKCRPPWYDAAKRCHNQITEYCCSGNLAQYIQNNHIQSLTLVKKWCFQILQALHFIHSQRPSIVHGDIRCENVFINGHTGTIKLGAFDRSKEGTSTGTDVYWFGITVLEMFLGTKLVQKRWKIADSDNKLTSEEKNILKDSQIRNFISRCLKPSESRPTAHNLLSDPFLVSNIREMGGAEHEEDV